MTVGKLSVAKIGKERKFTKWRTSKTPKTRLH